MKRATALLGVIALVLISFTNVLAQVKVEKPVLPNGYASWPYLTANTCKNLQENLWGRVDKEKGILEFVSLIKIDGRDIAFEYTGGDASSPKFSTAFLKQNGEWTEFDSMRMSQYNQYLNGLTAELVKNDPANCPQILNDGMNNFIKRLQNELKSKN